ncbi:Fibrinogen- domains (FReDs) [Branchiostoma belcheri]|nr:Fibrinogen- domains (FReDs) [Branchiostoma belcheri]
MARVLLLAVFLLSSSFPVRTQDTRTDQAGYVLREGLLPPSQTTTSAAVLEQQLAETKVETGRLKNQVDRLSSQVEALLSRADNLSAELSGERVRRAHLEQNLTQELQETRLLAQRCLEKLTLSTEAATPQPGTGTVTTPRLTHTLLVTTTTQGRLKLQASTVLFSHCHWHHIQHTTDRSHYEISTTKLGFNKAETNPPNAHKAKGCFRKTFSSSQEAETEEPRLGAEHPNPAFENDKDEDFSDLQKPKDIIQGYSRPQTTRRALGDSRSECSYELSELSV